jgi:hypothetical protein
LQPVAAGEKAERQGSLVEDIAHCFRALSGRRVSREHPFKMLASGRLIAEQVKRMAHQAVTDPAIELRGLPCDGGELLCQCQRRAQLSGTGARCPQPP